MLPFPFDDLDDRLSQSSLDRSGSSVPRCLLQGEVAEHMSISAQLLSDPTEEGCFHNLGAVSLKDCMSCSAFPCIFPDADFCFFFLLKRTPVSHGGQLPQPFLFA